MREHGFHVNFWQHAYVHPSSPIFNALKNAGVIADRRVWDGLVPDFTLAKAREIFVGLQARNQFGLGIDCLKLDECDGSDFTGGWFFPDETRFPSGLTGAQMHNQFGFLYQKAFHDWFRKHNIRSQFLVRGNFVGAQGYPSVVYSDYYELAQYVRANCNSGFSGVRWVPEVRQTQSAEDFVRRFQLTFFSSLAMINAWADGVLPWEKGPEVEEIFNKYVRLRMRLIPYIYAQFFKAQQTGVPMVRSLVMDFPDDPATLTIDDQYMFGDSMMIAPLLQGSQRRVYFPSGIWTDYWTGKLIQGGTTMLVDAPLATIPVYVREGSVIPMGPVMNYTGEWAPDEWEVHLYPGPNPVEFTLYDDDGESYNYERGKTWQVHLGLDGKQDNQADVQVTVAAPQGEYVSSIERLKFILHEGQKNPREKLIDLRSITNTQQTVNFKVGETRPQ